MTHSMMASLKKILDRMIVSTLLKGTRKKKTMRFSSRKSKTGQYQC